MKCNSTPVFDTLLDHPETDLDLLTNTSLSALSLALNCHTEESQLTDDSMAAKLIDKGCAVNVAHPDTGESSTPLLIMDHLVCCCRCDRQLIVMLALNYLPN